MRVNHRNAAFAQKAGEQIKGHQIAANGNELIPLILLEIKDRNESAITFNDVAFFGEWIALGRLLDLRAVNDSADVQLLQSIEQLFDGCFRAAPLGGIVLSQ